MAAARGGVVIVFEPDGRERERIRCPLPMVTSVCFGGDDLRDLYIVTGAEGAGSPDAGSVFKRRRGGRWAPGSARSGQAPVI